MTWQWRWIIWDQRIIVPADSAVFLESLIIHDQNTKEIMTYARCNFSCNLQSSSDLMLFKQ